MNTSNEPGSGDESEVADAAGLFADQTRATQDTPAAAPLPPAGEEYDVLDQPDVAPAPIAPYIEEPNQRGRAGAERVRERKKSSEALTLSSDEAVDQVWSRTAEWGGTIALLGFVGFAVFVLVYLLVQFEMFGPAFLVFLAGGVVFCILTYPLLITLERPVRVTPEQAVRDYYAALSHHVPHYRRMWLLLSSAGKVSSSYASFEGFRSYWEKRLLELKARRASSWTPLKFQIEQFRGAKSAGLDVIDVDFVVSVSVRGRQEEGTIEKIAVSATLVRGPDRMWYLSRGTLP